jgi:transcriptional regulator GlxA family with amidase domain
LSKGAQEASAQPLTVTKAGLLGDSLDRQPSLLDQVSGGLKTKILDIDGPADSRSTRRCLSSTRDPTASRGGPVPNSFGTATETEPLDIRPFDTLLVGSGTAPTPSTPKLLAFLREAVTDVRRVASICIGAFILAEAGVLDGRRATTHWAFAQELERRFPKVRVEMDRIFIADGPVWTSAGMTAGIDMALGLVERDLGSDIARATARMMVVHHHAPKEC